MPLDEAIERAIKIYEKERLHSAPSDAVAQHMGYKGANNGAALAALASLRYFGLLDRPSEGKLAVTKDVESYQYAPSEELKQQLRNRWLQTPPVFAELLEKYPGALPSDANLRFELIQKGFLPGTAESAIAVLRKSVEFTRYYDAPRASSNPLQSDPEDDGSVTPGTDDPSVAPPPTHASAPTTAIPREESREDVDRIPVRLSGGRRAWLVIPALFYTADKDRLKAQIDLLITQDEEQ